MQWGFDLSAVGAQVDTFCAKINFTGYFPFKIVNIVKRIKFQILKYFRKLQKMENMFKTVKDLLKIVNDCPN